MSSFALVVSIALVACTDGTTPDCAAVNCGPDLDGSVVDTGTKDGASDGASDAAIDAGDAGSDAPVDAPADAPKDAPLG
jgi:hypothetical protein